MTSSPVGAPRIWIIVLSPVVVPCTIDPVAASSAPRSRRSRGGERAQPGQHAHRLVGGGRRRLLEQHRPVGAEQDQVGERAPDVDSDASVADPPPAPRRVASGPLRRGRRLVDRQRQLLERAAQHHAVALPGRVERHVLVPHVVEHRGGVAVQRVAPAAAAAEVEHEPVAGLHAHPGHRRGHHHLPVGAREDALVGRARLAARYARVDVVAVHHVLVHQGRGADLLHEVRAAPASPLARPTRVGEVMRPAAGAGTAPR